MIVLQTCLPHIALFGLLFHFVLLLFCFVVVLSYQSFRLYIMISNLVGFCFVCGVCMCLYFVFFLFFLILVCSLGGHRVVWVGRQGSRKS